jgi:hypothetical protein
MQLRSLYRPASRQDKPTVRQCLCTANISGSYATRVAAAANHNEQAALAAKRRTVHVSKDGIDERRDRCTLGEHNQASK